MFLVMTCKSARKINEKECPKAPHFQFRSSPPGRKSIFAMATSATFSTTLEDEPISQFSSPLPPEFSTMVRRLHFYTVLLQYYHPLE